MKPGLSFKELERLSKRHREMKAEGLTNSDVAAALGVNERWLYRQLEAYRSALMEQTRAAHVELDGAMTRLKGDS